MSMEIPLKRKRSALAVSQDVGDDNKRAKGLSPASSETSNDASLALIPWLPSEIIPLIWQACDTDTLKNARLTCTVWAEEIGKFFFDKVTIIMHLYFMERFIYTFKSSKIRSHISQLKLDISWIEQTALLHGKYIGVAGFRYNRESRPHPSSMWTLDDLYDLYATDEVRSPYISTVEVAILTKIFSLIPTLTQLEIEFNSQPSEGFWWGKFQLPPSDTQRFRQPPAFRAFLEAFDLKDAEQGLVDNANSWATQQPYSIYQSIACALAFSDVNLRELRLFTLDPRQFNFRRLQEETRTIQQTSLFLRVCRRVQRFEVLLLDSPNVVGQSAIAESAAKLLPAMSPRSLKLWCHEVLLCRSGRSFQQTPPNEFAKPIFTFFNEQKKPSHFPGLTNLHLKRFGCQSTEICQFLSSHCPRLRSLTLEDFVLLEARAEKKDCWIRFLKTLKTIFFTGGQTQLETIDFRGFLTNVGRQHWHLDENTTSPTGSVRSKMIGWFLDREAPADACPLNIFEIKRGEADTNANVPDDALRKATDGTWSLECAPLEERNVSETSSDIDEHLDIVDLTMEDDD